MLDGEKYCKYRIYKIILYEGKNMDKNEIYTLISELENLLIELHMKTDDDRFSEMLKTIGEYYVDVF